MATLVGKKLSEVYGQITLIDKANHLLYAVIGVDISNVDTTNSQIAAEGDDSLLKLKMDRSEFYRLLTPSTTNYVHKLSYMG